MSPERTLKSLACLPMFLVAAQSVPHDRQENIMGKHESPEGYRAPALTDEARSEFDQVVGDVQKDLGFLRIEDAMGLLPPAQKRHRIAGIVTQLSRAAALGIVALAVMVGGGVVTARPASAATVTASGAYLYQHPTKFQRGTWADLGSGYVGVSAPLVENVPILGWIASPWETVTVQEYSVRRGRWVTRAVFRTNTDDGAACGMVYLGGGVHIVRVYHPADSFTLSTVGTTRRVYVTADPATY